MKLLAFYQIVKGTFFYKIAKGTSLHSRPIPNSRQIIVFPRGGQQIHKTLA